MKFYYLIVALFLSLNLYSQNAVVFAVHDGDSYRIRMDTSNTKIWVRLIGVDCPEVTSNLITKAQPYGRETGDSIRLLIKNKHVIVDSIATDVYKRMIVRMSLVDNSDTTDLTKYIVANGYGWASTKGLPVEYATELRRLQSEAMEAKLGLWGLVEKAIPPYIWRIRYQK